MMDNHPMQVLNLASISGVTAATMFVVEVVKRSLKDVKFLSKLPVFVYAGVISIVLSLLANKVLKTPDGSPLLSGSTWTVVWAAFISAMGSSGFYTWLRNPESVQTSSAYLPDKGDVIVSAKILVVLLVTFSTVACSPCPEKAILRDSMDAGTASIRRDHKLWSSKLVIDPATGKNHASDIKPLTAAPKAAIDRAHAEYEATVADDRKGDTK